jgi:thymidine kinase
MKKSPGKLEVVCGSMFSGKSEELMYRLRRAEYAKKKVLTIKHEIDNRKSFSCIVSHKGSSREAFPIGSCEDSLSALDRLVDDTIEVIGIDEIQFFPEPTIDLIHKWLDQGKRVIVAGLDLDFRGEPFGIVPNLLALADEVDKLRAICTACGDEANFSQRLINGKPARYDDATILVGGEECYEPRCRACFVLERATCLS